MTTCLPPDDVDINIQPVGSFAYVIIDTQVQVGASYEFWVQIDSLPPYYYVVNTNSIERYVSYGCNKFIKAKARYRYSDCVSAWTDVEQKQF